MPSEADMLAAYATGFDAGEQFEEYASPDWWRRVSRTYQDAMVQTLNDHRVTGTVLDCGAGWGVFVERYVAEGFTARGIEPSHGQAAYARSRGLIVEQGTLASLHGRDADISAITMFAVFEHLTDHAGLLADAYRLLKPGGLLITAHPTAACYNIVGNLIRLGNKHRQLPYLAAAFAAPWHTALMSVEGTKQLIHDAGFKLIDIRPAPQGRFDGMHGAIQIGLEFVNRVGWKLAGTRWPLVTTHIFVCQKAS
jgi:2-polyprenyl-3-methyl-5-hydroxy-6-metoxy-1,4-benzoquinol methylase